MRVYDNGQHATVYVVILQHATIYVVISNKKEGKKSMLLCYIECHWKDTKSIWFEMDAACYGCYKL